MEWPDLFSRVARVFKDDIQGGLTFKQTNKQQKKIFSISQNKPLCLSGHRLPEQNPLKRAPEVGNLDKTTQSHVTGRSTDHQAALPGTAAHQLSRIFLNAAAERKPFLLAVFLL